MRAAQSYLTSPLDPHCPHTERSDREKVTMVTGMLCVTFSRLQAKSGFLGKLLSFQPT